MQIKAIALDRELMMKPTSPAAAITDGSAGLPPARSSSPTIFGRHQIVRRHIPFRRGGRAHGKNNRPSRSHQQPTLNNAPFAGAQAVLQTCRAANLRFDSEGRVFYVRVPSGKQFYLYVLQTIDAADASLGRHRHSRHPGKRRPTPNQIKTMKMFYLIPLLFLSACSTAPKLALRPQQSPPMDKRRCSLSPKLSAAYHIGRYTDPNDDLIMHEQHVVYRGRGKYALDFHPGPADGIFPRWPPATRRFAPAPVNRCDSGRG